MCAARLITIPFSHYCEKARWALSHCGCVFYEDGHLPMLHWLPVMRVGGQRTVPTLVVDGSTLADSTDILEWADRRAPPSRKLYPESCRTEVCALEEQFDQVLGPASRRWVYAQLSIRRAATIKMASQRVPRWQAKLAPLWIRPFSRLIRRYLRIDHAGVARSLDRIEDIFKQVGEMLADGRAYLVGNQFTAADLTFAALAAPLILPESYGATLPTLDEMAEHTRMQIQRWRAHPAGAFALEIYRRHREPEQSSSAA
ncbi:MAG: glutathione S-transferase family protein [Nannocystaceae bacterium]